MVRGWTNTMGGVGASAADQLINRWSNSYTVGESLMMTGPVFPGDFSHQQEVLEGPLGGTQKIHWEWSQLGSTPIGVEGLLHYRRDAQGKGSDGGQGQPQPNNHPAGPQGWSRSRLRQKYRKLVRVSMVARHRHGTAQPGQGLGTSKAALAWQGRPQVTLSPAPSHAHPSCFPAAWSQVSLHQVKADLEHRQPDPKEDREEAQASDTAKVKWRNVSKCLQWRKHTPLVFCFPTRPDAVEDDRHKGTGTSGGAGGRQRLEADRPGECGRKGKSNPCSHLSMPQSWFSSWKGRRRTMSRANLQGCLFP